MGPLGPMGKRSSCLFTTPTQPDAENADVAGKEKNLIVVATCFGPEYSLWRVLSREMLCTSNHTDLSGFCLHGTLRAKMVVFQVRVAQLR